MERIFRFPIKVGKESIDVLGHTNNKRVSALDGRGGACSLGLSWVDDGRYLGIGKVFVASTHKIELLAAHVRSDELNHAYLGRDHGRRQKPPLLLSEAGQ